MAMRLLPIRKVTSDEHGVSKRIAKAGVYQMAIDAYHSDCCIAPSASSGDLTQINKSGEIYWANSYHNPSAIKKAPKDHRGHFNFGNAAHAKVVGGADWESEYIVRPAQWSSWRSEKSRIWRWHKEVRERKVCISQEEFDAVEGMVAKMQTHELARTLITNGIPELTLISQIGSVFIKARPDVSLLKEHPKHPGMFYVSDTVGQDYKTIDDNDPANCRAAIKKYRYDEKLANVIYLICRLFGLDFFNFSFALIFQAKVRPYGITVVELSTEEMWLKAHKNLGAVMKFQAGMSIGGTWDGYTDEIIQWNVWEGELQRIREQIKSGELPTILSNMKIKG